MLLTPDVKCCVFNVPDSFLPFPKFTIRDEFDASLRLCIFRLIEKVKEKTPEREEEVKTMAKKFVTQWVPKWNDVTFFVGRYIRVNNTATHCICVTLIVFNIEICWGGGEVIPLDLFSVRGFISYNFHS